MSSVRGPGDVGEPLAQLEDDRVGLVHRQRGLRDVGDPVRVVHLERVHVVLGLDQDDVLGRLAHRALDLLVAGVADEDDRVALLRRTSSPPRGPSSRAGRWRRSCAARAAPRWRARSARRRARRRPRSRPRAPRSPGRRRSRRASGAARRRACCARSPCARRPARRTGRARARPSGRPGPRPRSSRAARPGRASLGRPGTCSSECREQVGDRLAAGVERTTPTPPRGRRSAGASRGREVDQVDRRDSAVEERHVVVRDRALRARPGSGRSTPARFAAARSLAQSLMSECASRGIDRFLSATKSSRIIASALR